MIPRILIGSYAAIVLFLGGVHLAYTLFTDKFSPTEGQVETAMKQAAPRISRDMTMWKAWISFHVSHSMGLILFGLVYGYLAVCRWEVLQKSYFLAALGLLMLLGYFVMARVYWFTAPLIGVSLATLFYVAGLAWAFVRT